MSTAYYVDELIKDLPPLLSQQQLCELLSYDRTNIRHMIKRGFPRPIMLSSRTPRWSTKAIRDWLLANNEAVLA
jgi:predicted DNA-binding transcriptional regulator AlpA